MIIPVVPLFILCDNFVPFIHIVVICRTHKADTSFVEL